MRELVDIVRAFEALGETLAALASVVGVEGSSYRQPGARMLIAADGRSWGGVSGGCLERDVARRGRIVIDTGEPQVCVYETAEDGDEDPEAKPSPGPSLGCGGRIEILIERVSREKPGILEAMTAAVRQRMAARVATVVDARGSGARAGQRVVLIDGRAPISDIGELAIHKALLARMGEFSGKAQSLRVQSASVLLEEINPPRSLVIFGDGPDTKTMVEQARSLGWRTTICSGKSADELKGRLGVVDEIMPQISAPPADAAVVIMNHNLRRDTEALAAAVRGGCVYIGLLGPRRRSMKMVESLGEIGSEMRSRIFAPVGLDIGARTPESIALSVVAEICAVNSARGGGSLRQRMGPIHEQQPTCQE